LLCKREGAVGSQTMLNEKPTFIQKYFLNNFENKWRKSFKSCLKKNGDGHNVLRFWSMGEVLMFGVSSAVLPLASRRKCTGFLAVLAATSLALLCPRPATAQYGGTGSWSFTDVFHGESKQINGVEQPLGTDRPISAGGAWANDGANIVTPDDQYKTSASGSILIKGRDRIVGTWVPPYSPYSGSSSTATPTPPATVTIQVNSGAIASWASSWYYPEKLQGSLTQLDNGFGDPATLYPGSDRSWYCGGLHLKTLSTAGGSWVTDYNYSTKVYRVELPFDINMAVGVKASGSGYPPDPHNPSSVGTVSGRLGGVTAQEDSRSVQVVRSGAPFPKLDGDSTLNKDIDEWVEADGTGHGHTVYSDPYAPTEGVTNQQTMTAVLTGNIPPERITWQWTPSNGPSTYPYNDTVDRHMEEIPDSGSGGSDRTVTYDFTDSLDSAKGNAKYMLKLHDHWEKPTDDTSYTWPDGSHSGQTFAQHTRDLPVPRLIYPQDKDKTWTFADVTASWTEQLKTSFSLDFGVKDWLKLGGSWEQTGSLEIKAEYQATAPHLNESKMSSGYDAIPCVRYYVKTLHKRVEHWTEGGFDPGSGQTDKKWPQAADLPMNPNDVFADWDYVPSGQPSV